MFERFGKDLRITVVAAVNGVKRGEDRLVEPAHLFLAVLERDGRGAALLREAGLDSGPGELRAELFAVRRRAGLTEADADALGQLGIDVDTVVANVERSLGAGALDPQRRRRGLFAGNFGDEAKQSLVLALRQASALGSGTIDEVHLLLALLVQPGAVQDVLAARGIGYADVRRLADRAA